MTQLFLSQSWRPDTISHRLSQAVTTLLKYFAKWKLRLNAHKTEPILFSKRHPCLPDPVKLDNASVRWASDVKCLGLLLDPKLLYTKHLCTVSNKATGTLCNIYSLLNRDSTLTQTSKLTLYKLLIRSLLTYATPVWNTTCNSNYLKLQVVQNKSLLIIGAYPRELPSPISTTPLILNLFETSFAIWRSNVLLNAPNPLVQQIGKYTLSDLNSLYKIYKHKWLKHILL
jgi:hypothetical protein